MALLILKIKNCVNPKKSKQNSNADAPSFLPHPIVSAPIIDRRHQPDLSHLLQWLPLSWFVVSLWFFLVISFLRRFTVIFYTPIFSPVDINLGCGGFLPSENHNLLSHQSRCSASNDGIYGVRWLFERWCVERNPPYERRW